MSLKEHARTLLMGLPFVARSGHSLLFFGPPVFTAAIVAPTHGWPHIPDPAADLGIMVQAGFMTIYPQVPFEHGPQGQHLHMGIIHVGPADIAFALPSSREDMSDGFAAIPGTAAAGLCFVRLGKKDLSPSHQVHPKPSSVLILDPRNP